jgi:hypothetical protein
MMGEQRSGGEPGCGRVRIRVGRVGDAGGDLLGRRDVQQPRQLAEADRGGHDGGGDDAGNAASEISVHVRVPPGRVAVRVVATPPGRKSRTTGTRATVAPAMAACEDDPDRPTGAIPRHFGPGHQPIISRVTDTRGI